MSETLSQNPENEKNQRFEVVKQAMNKQRVLSEQINTELTREIPDKNLLRNLMEQLQKANQEALIALDNYKDSHEQEVSVE